MSILRAVAFFGALVVAVSGSDLHMAREAVEKAKRALKVAEKCFDTECTPDNILSLIAQIKDAERRLADTRSMLTKLQSSSSRGAAPEGSI